MASNNEGYWSRSWALLTRDKGWFKPLLVLSAAQMVPVVGQFGASGYALEWGRLTAWGVDSSPKQKGVKVGACIASGARAFVVMLGYALVIGIVRALLGKLLGDGASGIVGVVVSAAVSVLVTVATLRATIYQSIGAGYGLGRIWDMIKRDYLGLLRIMGMVLLLALGIGAMASLMVGIVMVAHLNDMIDLIVRVESSTYVDEMEVALMVLKWLSGMLPFLLVVGYLLGILGAGANMLEKAAVGLWMRQFDVQHWGESSDPLPGTQPGAPVDGYGYGQPNGSYGTPTSSYDAPTGTYDPAGTYGAPAANPYDAPTSTYVVPSSPVQDAPQATYAANGDRVVQNMPLSGGRPPQGQGAVPQDFDATPYAGGQTAWTAGSQPSPTSVSPAYDIPVAQDVPTFTLGGDLESTDAATESTTHEVGSTVSTFAPDDEATVRAGGLAAAGSGEHVPFTLFDEPEPRAAETVTLASDPVPAEPAEPAEPKPFTLDDAIEQSRAIVDADLTEPVAPPKAAIPLPASTAVLTDSEPVTAILEPAETSAAQSPEVPVAPESANVVAAGDDGAVHAMDEFHPGQTAVAAEAAAQDGQPDDAPTVEDEPKA